VKIDFSSDNLFKAKAFWITEENENLTTKDESLNWVNKAFLWYFNYSGISNSKIPSDISDIILEFFSKLLCLVLIVLFAPVMLLVALIIQITSPGKVFFKQTRVGKNGELFEIYKFRSMVENAEDETGHTLSWTGDPRITRFGAFLRKSHLDELPQLFNVLKGEMEFIGPRPERPEFTQQYDKTIDSYPTRHTVKPGITGLAQISLVYDADAEHKLKFDLLYIKNKNSMILKFLISVYTIKKMLFLKPTADLATK
jgi:lipopolysaccharide/colanic/teichoic acid biosynthesis glycosyltransferase